MESFYHTLKTEMVYFQRFRNLVEAIAHIRDYLHFYNHERLHSLTLPVDESHPLSGQTLYAVSCQW
jgi:transposase InsO family protein